MDLARHGTRLFIDFKTGKSGPGRVACVFLPIRRKREEGSLSGKQASFRVKHLISAKELHLSSSASHLEINPPLKLGKRSVALRPRKRVSPFLKEDAPSHGMTSTEGSLVAFSLKDVFNIPKELDFEPRKETSPVRRRGRGKNFWKSFFPGMRKQI